VGSGRAGEAEGTSESAVQASRQTGSGRERLERIGALQAGAEEQETGQNDSDNNKRGRRRRVVR
jgi:hypothetical protein